MGAVKATGITELHMDSLTRELGDILDGIARQFLIVVLQPFYDCK